MDVFETSSYSNAYEDVSKVYCGDDYYISYTEKVVEPKSSIYIKIPSSIAHFQEQKEGLALREGISWCVKKLKKDSYDLCLMMDMIIAAKENMDRLRELRGVEPIDYKGQLGICYRFDKMFGEDKVK